jgi:hypothetical protein
VSLTCLESWYEDEVRRDRGSRPWEGLVGQTLGQIGWHLEESTSQESRRVGTRAESAWEWNRVFVIRCVL